MCDLLMLKPFKRNVYRLQTIEQFVFGGDVTSCQITYHLFFLMFVNIFVASSLFKYRVL